MRARVAAAVLLALAALSAGSAGAATEEPSPGPTASPSTPPSPSTPASTSFAVDDAQLRWGINDEAQNRAFAPGTYNFVSAGVVPDPGSGGSTVRDGVWSSTGATAWSATAGAVSIEKRLSDGGFAPATFAGLSTQADGTPLGPPTSGTTSGHQVVVDGGTGTVDPAAGTATVQWRGSFSVLFYSGMSFFTVTDPRLEVTPGAATLTGEVGGYASDMQDTSVWAPVPAARVVLADLPRETFAIGDDGGFAATPRYLGVGWDGGGQVRDGPAWGSFPTSFVQQQTRVGAASYWYSSGGATDALKVAEPLTISWSADAPIPPAADPAATAGRDPTAARPKPPSAPRPPRATPTRSAPTTPTTPTTTTGTGSTDTGSTDTGSTDSATGTGDATTGVADAPDGGAVPLAVPQTFDPRLPTVPTVVALSPASAGTGSGSDHRWQWWLGSFLLLGAAGTSLITHRPTRSRGTS